MNILINYNKILVISAVIMALMFFIVMFYVNPMIDNKDGFGVIKLQLSFFVSKGIDTVNSWGDGGINRFKRYIFVDYIYAVSYVLFFVSILKVLIEKNRAYGYNFLIYIAVLAGLFDWVENSIEIAFISNMQNFSDIVFLLHSIFSLLKWLALPIVSFGIFKIIIGGKK